MLKNRIKKVIVSLVMFLVLFVEYSNYYYVYVIANDKLDIPVEVREYAENVYKALASTVDNNEKLYQVSVSDVEKLKLGKPYIIYDAADVKVTSNIYYFPIIDNNHIILELSVYTVGDELSASISEGISEYLEKVSYKNNSDMLLFVYEDDIYYETEDEMKILVKRDNFEELDIEEKNMQEYFISLSYENKKAIIDREKCVLDYSDIPNDIDCTETTNGFSQNDTYGKRLNTSGCEVAQTSNDCWAASVATTIRYVTGNTNVTCGNVSDAVGIERGEGGDIYDKQLGLALFGVYYTKMHLEQISFDSVKVNIVSQHPILISTYNENSGHALTIVGYSTYGAVKQVTVWNSGNRKFQTSEYKVKGTGFIYNNSNYVWKYSLCYK